MQRHRKTRITTLRSYPTGRATRLPAPRPAGLEPPRDEAPGPSRAGAGLSSASPAWRAPGLVLLRLISPLLEAAARPRVSGPVARDLTRWPALDAEGGWGWGTVRPCVGTGAVSAREWRGEDSPRWPSRDPLDALLGAPVRGMTTSACGGPSRILSRQAAIPSKSSLPSSPPLPSSSSRGSSSGSPLCLDFARRV